MFRSKEFVAPVQEPPRLARDTSGAAFVREDEKGTLRYVYVDGSLDNGSTVNIDNPVAFEVTQGAEATAGSDPVSERWQDAHNGRIELDNRLLDARRQEAAAACISAAERHHITPAA